MIVGSLSAPPPVRPRPDLARERLVVALDFATVEEAETIVDRLGDAVSFYKIGLHLQLAPGLHALVAKLRSAQKRIFLDLKYIDIPATVSAAVRSTVRLGVDFITVMGQQHVVGAAVDARRDARMKIFAVTALTAMSEEDVRREYYTLLTLREFVARRAVAAQRSGADGVISSPNEIATIRDAVPGEGFLIVTPGIRPVEAAPDDQKRTATPREAILRGADHLVVGRPIVRAGDPTNAARRIVDEIASALADRALGAGSPTVDRP